MIKFIRNCFKCDLSDARNDEFIWELADALLWRDECVSMAAIPSPVKEQPEANRYYDDAKYLIEFVTERLEESNDTRNNETETNVH